MRALLLILSLFACRGSSAAPPPEARTPLVLTWFGVAGWQLDAGSTTVLVDPYFSRPADFEAPIVPDAAAIAARAPRRADAILVGHTHVDHALDVPAVAVATGARVIGSVSAARLARAGGVPADRVVAVRGGERIAHDGWAVRPIKSLHSKIGEDMIGGEIPEDPALPMNFAGYAEGGAWIYLVEVAGRSVLFVGTANFIEAEVAGLRPDVAVIATGLRERVEDYTCRLLTAIGKPGLVYTNHFDDWQAPPVDAPVADDLTKFMAEVEACAPGTKVVVPKPFAAMTVP